MKNVFDEFISSLLLAKKTLSEFEEFKRNFLNYKRKN